MLRCDLPGFYVSVEFPPIPILDYEAVPARYRPRVWKVAFAILAPWLLQLAMVCAVYLPIAGGVAGHGYILLASLLFGIGFGSAMIARSGFRPGFKALWLTLYILVQLICLVYITVFAALACGAPDAM